VQEDCEGGEGAESYESRLDDESSIRPIPSHLVSITIDDKRSFSSREEDLRVSEPAQNPMFLPPPIVSHLLPFTSDGRRPARRRGVCSREETFF